MSDQEQLRLRCLELALGHHSGDPVDNAKRFAAFVSGEDAISPRQIIEGALEAAGVR